MLMTAWALDILRGWVRMVDKSQSSIKGWRLVKLWSEKTVFLLVAKHEKPAVYLAIGPPHPTGNDV